MTALQWVWLVLTVYGSIAGLVFVVAYWARAPWWQTPTGWNLMGMAVVLTAACAMLASGALGRRPDPLVWVVVVAVIDAVMTHRIVLMYRASRRPR